ncbi:MAG: type IV secretion system DNA-binding domain-containing protein [Pseudorhodobacter sp.]|nr:type IV secretion system DNA-binding domain-containing protein [Pseudorhodobacter sp.]
MTERPPYGGAWADAICRVPIANDAHPSHLPAEIGPPNPVPEARRAAVRLRPTGEAVPVLMPDRDAVLWGLPASGQGFTRSLRVTYLVRGDGVLEASIEVATLALAPHIAPQTGDDLITEQFLETLARVALPGFAPVAPVRALFAGEIVRLVAPRQDVFAGTDSLPGPGALGPRPAPPTGANCLYLPAAGAVTLALDRTLVALAEADACVDLALEIIAMPLSAAELRALVEARRRLGAIVDAEGVTAAIQTMRLRAKIDDWLYASDRVLRIEAALRFAGPADPAVVRIAGGLIFGSLAPAASQVGEAADLSSCLSPEHPLPALVPMSVTPAALAEIARSRHLPPPKSAAIRFGLDAVGRDVAVGADDLRQHCYIVGATGTGKSTLLKSMILQDASAGIPAVVVDPHGDLYSDLINSLPKSVLQRAIIADVSDFAAPFSLNILDVRGPHAAIQRNFIANQLIALFKTAYGENKDAFGPMFESYFRGAVLLIMEAGGREASLADMERVFGDSAYRANLLGKCQDAQIVSFWRNIAQRAGGDASLENIAPYITSKLAQLSGNALVRPIVCSPHSTLDLPAALAEGRSVLVNLAKGLVGGPDAAMIGGIITIRLFAAAMARAREPVTARRLVRVYLDEFQTYGAHQVLSEAMAEVRKYGLSLVLANQSVAQIDGRGSDVAHAILGNTGNLVSFRVGPKDAAIIAEWLGPEVSPQTIMRLPNHTCVARLLRDGVPLPPTVVRPAPAR